jgi:hypothetical protein
MNGRSEGGCRRRFSLVTPSRCFSTSLAVLSTSESSSVVGSGSVAVKNPGKSGDDGDVDVFALETAGSRSGDPDVLPVLCTGY